MAIVMLNDPLVAGRLLETGERQWVFIQQERSPAETEDRIAAAVSTAVAIVSAVLVLYVLDVVISLPDRPKS